MCGEDVLTSQPRASDGEGNYTHEACIRNGGRANEERTLRGQCRVCGEGVYTDQPRSRDMFGRYTHDACDDEDVEQDEDEDDDDAHVVVYRVLNGGSFELASTSDRGFQRWDAMCKLLPRHVFFSMRFFSFFSFFLLFLSSLSFF